MPCLDAVLKACRRGTDRHGRIAALLKQEQQRYSTDTCTCASRLCQQSLRRSIRHSTPPSRLVLRQTSRYQWTGFSQNRFVFVNAAVDRHRIVAMSDEVGKAKEAAASGYAVGVFVS